MSEIRETTRRVEWTRDEFVLALALYHEKGLLDDKTIEVIELSKLLRNMAPEEVDLNPDYRNANGIALRLANFASVDPNYAGKGMAGLSKLGHRIWEEFKDNNDMLFAEAQKIRTRLQSLETNQIAALVELNELSSSFDVAFNPENQFDERERVAAEIVRRRGQSEFRKKLLAAYEGRCAITNCDAPDVLEAAHILGYSGMKSNHVSNGVLLRADIHILFDMGYISINPDNWDICIAEQIKKTEYAMLAQRKFRLPNDDDCRPSVEALRIHMASSYS